LEVAEESAMDQCDDLRALFSGQNLKKATQVGLYHGAWGIGFRVRA
jgi:hypothetical protein